MVVQGWGDPQWNMLYMTESYKVWKQMKKVWDQSPHKPNKNEKVQTEEAQSASVKAEKTPTGYRCFRSHARVSLTQPEIETGNKTGFVCGTPASTACAFDLPRFKRAASNDRMCP